VLDHEREVTSDWLQREQAVGYVTYVDRFAGTLAGLRERLSYLRELGITYLHLMPLLRARPAPNDGGYAVLDYGAVEPRLGTLEQLRTLATDLRSQGIALCIDVVLGHTAAEHAWTGRPDFYYVFPDRAEPDRYERTLPEAFAEMAPGNFTRVNGRWVWATFNSFQWDLKYGNPEVFVAMTEAMLALAQVGVDVLRLDAVPYLWKRLGTNCQNQPEVHDLLQAFRAVFRIAVPAVSFKAEAIVAPRDLLPYLGTGKHEGKECDLAYHNVLMVLLWSALASGRVALLTSALNEIPAVPPGAGWITYVRGHDDIGWAITEEDAGRAGEDAHLHRKFLSDFYAGEFPGTFARGARFQPEPLPGEARTSGTTASLAGLESAPVNRQSSWRSGASCSSTRLPSPMADCRSSTWATRSACSMTPPAARIPTTGGCTGPSWIGRRSSVATTPRPWRGACGQGCAGWSPRAGRLARSMPRDAPRPAGRVTTTCSRSRASTPASAC
jgi:amylosucrase